MKKKALNIIQRYYPANGGAELFMKLMSEYLANSLDFDVDVWTSNAMSADTLWDLGNDIIATKEERINNVNVKRYPIGKGILKYKYPNKMFRVLFENFPDFKIANLATCPTVFDMLEDVNSSDLKQYDVVTVSSTPNYFLFYVGYLLSKKLNIPYIIVPAFHPGLGGKDELRKKYFKKTAIPFFEHTSKIILNTKSEGEAIVKFGEENNVKIEADKFEIVGQGVFPEQINKGDGRRFRDKYKIDNPIVFQVGSKTMDKGSYDLINAMKRCWDNGVDSTLVFAGPYNKDFSEYINGLEKRYREKILNIDNVIDEEKWDLYDAGDLFSMVSKTDSFGIVYLESWVYGKPVLACNNSVMKEIIDDDLNGYLIDYGNIGMISDMIMRLLKDKELAKKIGENGKTKVYEKYNWNKNLKKLDQIYTN
ncbi:MAG: glycosyltransferase family 4 protein [Candidatus Dojkabacteria bacterium]